MFLKLGLKGPKREIFVAGIFAQIRPIWIGDLGTRPKNPKNYIWGLKFQLETAKYLLSDIGDNAKKIIFV